MADDDTDHTDNLSTPAMDRVTAAIAWCDFAAEMYDLATNRKVYKAELRKREKLEKEIAAAERNLASVQAQAAELVAKAESDVKAINDATQRRLEAATAAEDELVERERRITQLEQSWRGLGEPQDVLSGFRSPEFSPLQKARRAHGQPPGKDPDRLFSEPDAEPDHVIDAYIRRDVGDERSDHQGNVFVPGSSLTRDLGHKRGAT
jgi:hypothetical protein